MPPLPSAPLPALAVGRRPLLQRNMGIRDPTCCLPLQLADIYDYVSPCFPEKYRIFHVIWRQYHENLAFMMDCMGACAQQLANGDILKVGLGAAGADAGGVVQ